MGKRKLLTRYWFKLDADVAQSFGIRRDYGVTAHSIDDAILLLTKHALDGRDLAKKFELEIDIDVDTLDHNHVTPNIGDCSIRGVWFPNLGCSVD
ncbi:MAG: hypothetical protein R3E58_08480 [Phycisphaerae bacterium]|nr:hypothetical protein [Phycisphaerales bacterium]